MPNCPTFIVVLSGNTRLTSNRWLGKTGRRLIFPSRTVVTIQHDNDKVDNIDRRDTDRQWNIHVTTQAVRTPLFSTISRCRPRYVLPLDGEVMSQFHRRTDSQIDVLRRTPPCSVNLTSWTDTKCRWLGGGVVFDVDGDVVVLVLDSWCCRHWLQLLLLLLIMMMMMMACIAVDWRAGAGSIAAGSAECWHLDGRVGSTTAARLEQCAAQSTEQQPSEVLAKRLRQKRVEDGIDAAVHIRETVGEDLEGNDPEFTAWCVVLGTVLRQEHNLPRPTYTANGTVISRVSTADLLC